MDKVISKKRKVLYLIIALVIISAITFAMKYISLVNILAVKLVLQCVGNLIMGLIAYLFIKLTDMTVDYGFKNGKSYLIGLIIAIALQIVIGIIPALLGQSLVGSHREFVLWQLIYNFFFYVLIIGPIEELFFRVYVQDTIIELLPRCKWLGVIIASVLFGFWHIINGNLIQVLFTAVIGCVFGFAKYFIKNCKYSGVAFAHGLYDFLNVVTTILIVK